MTKAGAALTRKLGPLPGWAWAGLALAATFLYLRGARSAGPGLPYTPAAATSPASSGQGTPPDNANADLLAALGQQSSALDALLSAVQSGGGYGSTQGAGQTSGSDTEAATAPSVGGDNPPTDPGAPAAPDPVPPFDPGQGQSSQTYVVVVDPETGASSPVALPPGSQNEQGYQQIVTPQTLAPGENPTPGQVYAA